VGRKKVNFEQMAARFPEGTLARIDGARRDAETRTTFVQEAVEREIERREKPKP
jgi:predicted DNA-binding protein